MHDFLSHPSRPYRSITDSHPGRIRQSKNVHTDRDQAMPTCDQYGRRRSLFPRQRAPRVHRQRSDRSLRDFRARAYQDIWHDLAPLDRRYMAIRLLYILRRGLSTWIVELGHGWQPVLRLCPDRTTARYRTHVRVVARRPASQSAVTFGRGTIQGPQSPCYPTVTLHLARHHRERLGTARRYALFPLVRSELEPWAKTDRRRIFLLRERLDGTPACLCRTSAT